ncbi:MAG: histidine phosphatase family protein [Nesterenkonia sp.]|uniref:SixA phosphatase family protein n=1 Tax=Nesterenkonia marinintestina TaxID=2979865 RepID=UPI0021C008B4|nr:histidine phosphatase family protein [Nesterenkonia sp. GX14115]MDO5492811.1 histidine phosphatase family protein [Nesterenkonia sp.]
MTAPAQLLILRHAKAGHAFDGDDAARTLTDRGADQARTVGRRLADEGFHADHIICSDAMRTRQTAVWVCHELGEDASTPYLDPRLYLADPATMLAVINETPETVRTLLVVAHMPGVQELSMRLAAPESEEDPVLRMAGSFPTSGLARFEVDGPWAELDGRDARLTDFWD